MAPATTHIINNFELYGFGDPELALFQTVKELCENSYDACRRTTCKTQRKTAIRIEISKACSSDMAAGDSKDNSCSTLKEEGALTMLKMKITDNGCGIQKLDKFLRAFESSLSNEERSSSTRVGKFGVGLTASLLYAQMRTGQGIRVVTKTEHQAHFQGADFWFDLPRGDLKARELGPMIIKDGIPSGTWVEIHLCAPETLSSRLRVWATISEHLNKFVLTSSSRSTSITFEDTSGVLNHGRNHAVIVPGIEEFSADKGRCDSENASSRSSSGSCASCLRRLNHYFQSHSPTKNKDKGEDDEEEMDQGERRRGLSDLCTERRSNKDINVQLVRLVNGVPLHQGSQEGNCAIVKALMKTRWLKYGVKFVCSVAEEDQQTNGGVTYALKGVAEAKKMEDEVSCLPGVDQVVITVAFKSQKAKYNSFTKDSVFPEQSLVKHISTCIDDCLKILEAKSQRLNTSEDAQSLRRDKIYLPMITNMVTNIILASANDYFRDSCLRHLEASDESSFHRSSIFIKESNEEVRDNHDVETIKKQLDSLIVDRFLGLQNSDSNSCVELGLPSTSSFGGGYVKDRKKVHQQDQVLPLDASRTGQFEFDEENHQLSNHHAAASVSSSNNYMRNEEEAEDEYTTFTMLHREEDGTGRTLSFPEMVFEEKKGVIQQEKQCLVISSPIQDHTSDNIIASSFVPLTPLEVNKSGSVLEEFSNHRVFEGMDQPAFSIRPSKKARQTQLGILFQHDMQYTTKFDML